MNNYAIQNTRYENSMIDVDAEYYINLIKEALDRIGAEYYKLPTTYNKKGIVRERVFCYELYHQIRLMMKDTKPITINGEIDKRGHDGFLLEHQKNPDLVVHAPGQYQLNIIVIEVKGKLHKRGIKKDFETLIAFTNMYAYKLGIFILYNYSLEEFKKYLSRNLSIINSLEFNKSKNVNIVCKKSANEACEDIWLTDL